MTVQEYNDAVERYADGVFRFVVKNLRDEERARDVVQDSFEKLWRHHGEVDAPKVKSYLFSTAYHTLIDSVRRSKKQGNWEHIDPLLTSDDRGYSDLNEVLHRAIDQLPEVQKMVVMLRDYEGYSYREIGEIAHLSEAQVKVYIFRARVFLKNYIGKMDVVV